MPMAEHPVATRQGKPMPISFSNGAQTKEPRGCRGSRRSFLGPGSGRASSRHLDLSGIDDGVARSLGDIFEIAVVDQAVERLAIGTTQIAGHRPAEIGVDPVGDLAALLDANELALLEGRHPDRALLVQADA